MARRRAAPSAGAAALPNVVLVGMPGSGKSVVGERVAAWLGWPLLDTDEMVVRRAGRPIAEIFAQDDEAAFRRLEQAAVAEAARARRAVIATGGGVVLDRANMAALRRRGWIVALATDPGVLLARLGPDGGGRPLLAPDPRARVQILQAERAPRYAEADLVLDAARPAEDLAHAVLAALAAHASAEVPLDLGPRSYAVRIGAGVLDLLGWEVGRRFPGAQAVLLTHPRLRRRFGTRIEGVLRAAGMEPLVVAVPEGERAKSLPAAAGVFARLAAAGVDRSAVVVALGGGVIGDLGGFVAGTYMRGLALVHVPTTLLAQVDSAIGGKAALNHPRAKNLVGVFHQPALVLADVETLQALPPRQVRAGLAEVIKYGMACDAGLLAFTEEHLAALLRRDRAALQDCVRWCASVKARIVQGDEREEGARRLLNYGHTVGHAVEINAGGALGHGEAVAIGMSVEVRVAARLNMVPAAVVRRQDAVLQGAGLPTLIPPAVLSDDHLIAAMRLDKKTRRGTVQFTLLAGVGHGVIDQPVPAAVVREALSACRASS